MFKISRKLWSSSLVLVLILSLGLSVKPAQASATPCNPAYVIVRGHQFTVTPSSGDDTTNLQCALDAAKAAGPSSTVQLVKGSYITGLIEVAGFDGYFKGAGMGQTVITPLAALDCASLGNQNILPSLFIFRLGNPRIMDMTVNFDKANPCGAYNGGPLESVFYLTGSRMGTTAPCANLKPEHGQGSFSRVEVTTNSYATLGIAIEPESAFDPVLNIGCVAQTAGDYQVTDSLINGFNNGGTGLLTGSIGQSHLLIDHNTFTNNFWGFIDQGMDGVNVELSRNTFSKNFVSAVGQSNLYDLFYGLTPGKPVNYHFHDNTIVLDPASANTYSFGLLVIDVANIVSQQPSLNAVIDHNTITASSLEHFGAYFSAVKNILVLQNTVTGTGGGGFIFDDSFWGTGSIENAMIVMNDLSHFTMSSAPDALAPIYLGKVTLHCTVIGQNLKDDVVNLGTGNILINVHQILQGSQHGMNHGFDHLPNWNK